MEPPWYLGVMPIVFQSFSIFVFFCTLVDFLMFNNGSWNLEKFEKLPLLGSKLFAKLTPTLDSVRRIPSMTKNHGLSRFEGTCLCFNLVMGAGFLALPSTMVQAGWALGAGLSFAAALVLITTALLEGEIIIRCTVAQRFDAAGGSAAAGRAARLRDVETVPLARAEGPGNATYAAVAAHEDSNGSGGGKLFFPGVCASVAAHMEHLSGRRTVEMTEVCEMLVGPGAKLAYCACLVSYQVCHHARARFSSIAGGCPRMGMFVEVFCLGRPFPATISRASSIVVV